MALKRLRKLKLSLINIILGLNVKPVLEQTKKSKTKVQRTIEKNITNRTLVLEWNRLALFEYVDYLEMVTFKHKKYLLKSKVQILFSD